jgi:hypothetical protein
MSLKIEELWVPVDIDGELEWKECVVISLYKASMQRANKDESISTEQMFAICYYPVTGEIIETPINETIIKILKDETGKLTNFSAPSETEGERRKNR